MLGQSINHYKITAKLGEGGMGAVYRATDTRLGRDVALKIVPEKFARDPQRMGRFQREAEVLASLDHPNISTIHGLEVDGDVQALVLELVEGLTLAETIAKGRIPTEEALGMVERRQHFPQKPRLNDRKRAKSSHFAQTKRSCDHEKLVGEKNGLPFQGTRTRMPLSSTTSFAANDIPKAM